MLQERARIKGRKSPDRARPHAAASGVGEGGNKKESWEKAEIITTRLVHPQTYTALTLPNTLLPRAQEDKILPTPLYTFAQNFPNSVIQLHSLPCNP